MKQRRIALVSGPKPIVTLTEALYSLVKTSQAENDTSNTVSLPVPPKNPAVKPNKTEGKKECFVSNRQKNVEFFFS